MRGVLPFWGSRRAAEGPISRVMEPRPTPSTSVPEATRLLEAAKALSGTLDRDRVFSLICEEAATILGADAAAIYTGDSELGLEVEAAYGLGMEIHGLRLRPGQGLAGLVAERDEPMLTNDYQRLTDIPDAFSEFCAALAVPIHWEGRLRGVLSVGWRDSFILTFEQLELLRSFGELAASAARNASLHAGLERAARTDALTGCLNRGALHQRLEAEIERARRTGSKLSLVMVDLDHFKQINERHGHLAGDEVLIRVGRGLIEAVRSYDSVGRYGGDEFAVISVEADEADAAEVAGRALERVNASVGELGMADAAAGAATAGVAEWDGEEPATALIERADHALLYGKQAGRRGVVQRASQAAPDFVVTSLSSL